MVGGRVNGVGGKDGFGRASVAGHVAEFEFAGEANQYHIPMNTTRKEKSVSKKW